MAAKLVTAFERRLAEFVDRDTEVKQFCGLLESSEKAILYIWGGGGVGKSQLLARMEHECSVRKLRKAEVVWTETRNHDYLGIMRKVRDDLGAEAFSPFTHLVNTFYDPSYQPTLKIEASGVSVGNGMQIEGSRIGDIGGVVIKDSMIVVPRPDQQVPEQERMATLTDGFIECLATLAADGPQVVVFFDTIEKMTTETATWLGEELLRPLAEGRLQNLRFVLSGRKEPDLDREVLYLVEETRLEPLQVEHIEEYLEKRGIDESDRPTMAKLLMLQTKGHPLEIAQLVDAFLKM